MNGAHSYLRVPVLRRALVLLLLAGSLAVVVAAWQRTSIDPSLIVSVHRGTLTTHVTATGTLRPIAAMTYRSPLHGREAEIVELAPEGQRVKEGDVLARFDTTELQIELERAERELRQTQADLQIAEGQRQEAEASVTAASEGEGALAVEEARARVQMIGKRVERLKQEHAELRPLLAKGFITREELARTSDQLEQAEEELRLARRRTDVVARMAQPREQQRAALQLAQKRSQLENAAIRVQEVRARIAHLRRLIASCTVRARRAGMIVYDELVNAMPQRKVRVGDRVNSSQGVITIPEVDRMLVEASVGEAEVHRIRPGQPAVVRLEAYPDLRLSGRVARVGTLASSSADRPAEDKRFDLIVELDSGSGDLRPGMTARADILASTRAGVLLVPVTAIFQHEGNFVAHVVRGSRNDARRLELGESNDEFVEVLSGLREGERVTLLDPRASAESGRGAPRQN